MVEPAFYLLLLAPSLVHARTWRTNLVEGYQEEWKFVARFAFTPPAPDQESGGVRMNAWTFMANQRVLLYSNDDWFEAQQVVDVTIPGVMAIGGVCERRASLAFANATVPQGRFYGEAR